MNYAQVRAFHAVAETGGITTAAERLSVTQPAITLHLKGLMEHYGVTLIYRNGRNIQLTEEGRQLFSITKRLFGIYEEAEAYLEALNGLEQGHINIGADSPYHVMKLMAAFRAAHPGITISIALGNTTEVYNDILNFQTDVAIAANFEPHPKIFMVPYSSSPLVVIVSSEHPWARRKSVRLEELDGAPMIKRESGSATRATFDQAARNAGVVPKVIYELDTREAVREAVAQNMGIGVVQQSELGNDSRLHALKIRNAHVVLNEYVIFLKERRDSSIVSAFHSLVLDQLKSSAPPAQA